MASPISHQIITNSEQNLILKDLVVSNIILFPFSSDAGGTVLITFDIKFNPGVEKKSSIKTRLIRPASCRGSVVHKRTS